MRTVALIGRPNVGKSTLFNRLTGRRTAIVDPTPGVTRDWLEAETDLDGVSIRVLDTGGLTEDKLDPFTQGIRDQTAAAMARADVLVFVVARGELTADDHMIAEMVRLQPKPVILAVNKIDGEEQAAELAMAYELGLKGEIIGFSAGYGYNIAELIDLIRDEAQKILPEPAAESQSSTIHLAIVGRPNAGKSTLFNSLLGMPRALVSEVAGTTRDALTETFRYGKTDFVVVDTAGLRRRTKIDSKLERYSASRAIDAIERSDVTLLMIDAAEQVAEQDKKIAQVAVSRGKGLVLALNKIDLLEGESQRLAVKDAREWLSFRFPAASFAPVYTLNAKEGRGLESLLTGLIQVFKAWQIRVQTSELNRVVRDAIEKQAPPISGRGRLKVYFAQQGSTAPPMFTVSVSHPDAMQGSYLRYLENILRNTFKLNGVPIRWDIRGR